MELHKNVIIFSVEDFFDSLVISFLSVEIQGWPNTLKD